MARSLIDSEEDERPPELTDYVATRWYRAPEILAGSRSYGCPVDLWSLGGIFGEMLGGKPVFAGSSTLNQLEKIVEVLGMPSKESKEKVDSVFINSMVESLTNSSAPVKTFEEQKEAWKKIYETASDDAIDLLTRLMQFNPAERMTAKEGLTHPYCSQFHDEESEIEAKRSVNCEVPSEGKQGTMKVPDNTKMGTAFYREQLYTMIKMSKK